MDDEIARDGTLARCNQDREATAADIECANARRAAAAIALLEERARREVLELESERKLAQLRAEVERERAAARAAHERAEAAARAAYDAQWSETDGQPVGADGQPLPPGAVVGIDGLPVAEGAPATAGAPVDAGLAADNPPAGGVQSVQSAPVGE